MKKGLSLILSLLLVLSIATTGMVGLTASAAESSGATAAENFDKLVEYIEENGEYNKGGGKEIRIDRDGSIYIIRPTDTGIEFLYQDEEQPGISFRMMTYFTLERSSKEIEVSATAMYSNAPSFDAAFGSKIIDRSTFSSSKEYNVSCEGTTGIITDDMYSQLFTASLQLLCKASDTIIYSHLGFGLKGLGFVSYSDGLGSTACDPLASYHTGDTETRNAVEATCAEDGYTGDTYCACCGEKLSNGDVISSEAISHKDDNNDGKCDVCEYVMENENTGDTPDTPDTPNAPDTPEEPENPETGDNTALIAIGAIAVLAFVVLVATKKRAFVK